MSKNTIYLPLIPDGKCRGRTLSCDLLSVIGGEVPPGYSSPKKKVKYEDISPILKHVGNPDVPFQIFTRTDHNGKYRWEKDYEALTLGDHEQHLSQLFRLDRLNETKNWNTESRRHIREKTKALLQKAMQRGINFHQRGINFQEKMTELVI